MELPEYHGGEPLSKAGIAPVARSTRNPCSIRLAAKTYVISPENIIESDYNVTHCGVAEA